MKYWVPDRLQLVSEAECLSPPVKNTILHSEAERMLQLLRSSIRQISLKAAV